MDNLDVNSQEYKDIMVKWWIGAIKQFEIHRKK